MRICIVGGGNIGTLLAAESAVAGHDITVLTSRPDSWTRNITVKDIRGNTISVGSIQCITNDLEVALHNQDYIFVTYPSDIQNTFAKRAAQYVHPGMRFVMLPGYGGTEFLMDPVLQRGAILVGFQRVHAIARLIEYGHSVCMRSRKNALQMATYSYGNVDENTILDDIRTIFSMPVDLLPNYLNVTFTPSNPVLHTARLYAMFRDYHDGIFYAKNIPFYDTWDDSSSEVMISLDTEVQELCSSLCPLDLHYVKSLRDHYESPTVSAMTYKLTHIDSFHGILSPMKHKGRGWIPDFQNRYFSDFAYGLTVLHQFSHVCNLDVPTMDLILDWYHKVTLHPKAMIDIGQYGIRCKQDILDKYC